MMFQEAVAVTTTLTVVYLTFLRRLEIENPSTAVRTLLSTVRGVDLGLSEVHLRITEKRQEIWLACATLSAVASELYCMLQMGVFFCLPSNGAPYKQVHFWTALSSSIVLRWTTTRGRNLSPKQIQLITLLINVVGLVNRADLPDMFVPANYMGRVFIGSFSPDLSFSVWVNALLMPVFVAVGCSRVVEASVATYLGLLANEILVVVFMACVFGQINSTTYRQEVATMEVEQKAEELENHATETQNILRATMKLLSVTCDCCEKLSHDWDIIEPTQRVLELFRHPGAKQKAGDKPLSLPLRQCIYWPDQDRFSDFVSSSGESNTPSLLHLRMKDFSGKAFDAQLFHVNVPSLLTSQPQHLVGIIVTSRGCESIPAIPEGEPLEVATKDETESQHDSASFDEHASSRMRNIWVSDAAGLAWQALTGKLQDWLETIDHVGLNLDLQTREDGYAIRSITIRFKDHCPSNVTTFYSVIKPKYQVIVEDWLQEHVNSWYHSVPCDEHCLGVKLNVPMFGSILVGDMTVAKVHERGGEDELSLDVDLELRNFLVAPRAAA